MGKKENRDPGGSQGAAGKGDFAGRESHCQHNSTRGEIIGEFWLVVDDDGHEARLKDDCPFISTQFVVVVRLGDGKLIEETFTRDIIRPRGRGWRFLKNRSARHNTFWWRFHNGGHTP